MMDKLIDEIKFFLEFVFKEFILKAFKDIIFYIFLMVFAIFIYENITEYGWIRSLSHTIYKCCLYAFIVILLVRCCLIYGACLAREKNDREALYDEVHGWDRGFFWSKIIYLYYIKRDDAGMAVWGSGLVYVLAGILLLFI